MKKLWHIWTAFVFCLVIGLTGMTWLTVRAVDLDRAEARARHEAARAQQQKELQERIAMALWRMDWTLTPLIAQEATRPSFVYRPFLKTPSGKGKAAQLGVPSPLLTQPPDYVVLNFDVSLQNGWTSPQSPKEINVPEAVAAGVSPDLLYSNRSNLKKLGDSVSFDRLLALLPDALLPSATEPSFHNGANAAEDTNSYEVLGQQQMGWQQTIQTTQQGDIQQSQQAMPQPQTPQANALSQQRLMQQQAEAPQRGYQNTQTREQLEWSRRNVGVQNFARSQRAQVMSNSVFLPDETLEQEGVSRPMWLDSRLILARRVVSNGDVRVQGCWLDWPRIKSRLQDEVVDLFPEIELLPVADNATAPPGHLLATLPVRLVVPETSTKPETMAGGGTANLSAIRISLVIAWCCLLLGSVAIAIMLRSVLALSERRASFVSAVTHELRSPLTTFRMYAEMLAEGMVRDDQQRDRYLTTLRQEADRLSHLVDNVLQYARIERGRCARRRVKVAMKDLMQQTTERLPQRVRQAGMELHETVAPQDAKTVILTDPAAVEQILFNLIDNSCKYASSAEDRRIHVHWSVGLRVAQVRVTDHGPGIQGEQAKKLFHPFSKSDQEAAQSAPGIGLGLALCRRLASEIGGKLHFDSEDRAGAAFLLELPLA